MLAVLQLASCQCHEGAMAAPWQCHGNDMQIPSKIRRMTTNPSKIWRMTANPLKNSENVKKYARKQIVHTSRVPRFRKKSKIDPKTNSSHFSGSLIPEKIENRPETE